MPEPVKTLLLRAIETAIEETTEPANPSQLVFTVIRNPFQTKSLETVKFPLVFVFDETEDKKPRNRLADCYLPLHLELWVQAHEEGTYTELSVLDQTDYYAALIEQRLVNIKTFYPGNEWIRQVIPRSGNSVTKFLQDEFLGGAILLYDALYLHEWGNPFNPVRT